MEEAMKVFLAIMAIALSMAVPIAILCLVVGLRSRLQAMKYDLRRLSGKIDKLSDGIAKPAMEEAPAEAPATVPAELSPAALAVEPAEPAAVKPPPVPPALPREAAAAPAAPEPAEEAEPSRPAPEIEAPKPAPEPEPRTPTRLEESARGILGRMWNWILVGEEHRPHGVTAEYAVASVWLLRVGIAAVVTGIAFFLLLPLEGSSIGREARIAASMTVGLLMLGGGVRLLHKKYHEMGQGFFGGGIVALYLSGWASSVRYEVLPVWVGYGMMALVTVAAGIVAVKSNSLLIAIMGIVGGYVTPVLLSTGSGNLPLLYGYILLLSLGILGVAHRRQWHLMNYLAFIFTYALFFLSMEHYAPKDDFRIAIVFLSLFFVIHSSITYVYNILAARRSTVLEVIHMTINALMFSTTAYFLIEDAHGRPYPSIMSVSLAVFYVAHVWIFIRRKLVDRTLLITLLALAGVFVVWTMPLVFEKETLTIGFSLVALMFLWLGQRMDSNVLQHMGYGLYAFVFFRLLALDTPGNFADMSGAAMPMEEYWGDMVERLWTFGTSIASIAAGFYLQRRQLGTDERMVPETNGDMPAVVSHGVAGTVFYWFGILFAFLFVQLEFSQMFRYFDVWRLPVLTALWCAMGGYFLWKYMTGQGRGTAFFVAMCVFLGAAILKILAFDLTSWDFCDEFVYDIDYPAGYALARLLDFGAVMALLCVTWRMMLGRDDGRVRSYVFGYLGLLVLVLYATLELNSMLYKVLPEFRSGGITVLWAAFAITFIGFGIWKTVRSLRYVGLVLFVVVVLKVFFHDLRDLEVLYRVIAAVVVGVVLLLGSFSYIFSSKKFTRELPAEDNPDGSPPNE